MYVHCVPGKHHLKYFEEVYLGVKNLTRANIIENHESVMREWKLHNYLLQYKCFLWKVSTSHLQAEFLVLKGIKLGVLVFRTKGIGRYGLWYSENLLFHLQEMANAQLDQNQKGRKII